jgi:hypothetical protein
VGANTTTCKPLRQASGTPAMETDFRIAVEFWRGFPHSRDEYSGEVLDEEAYGMVMIQDDELNATESINFLYHGGECRNR